MSRREFQTVRSSRRFDAGGLALVLILALGGCGGGSSSPASTSPPPASSPRPIASLAPQVKRVFTQLDFQSPVAMMQTPSDSSRWYVVERAGSIRSFANDPTAGTSTLVLDFTTRVDTSEEGGLLGMAFHPTFPNDPRVFLYYTTTQGGQFISRLSAFTAVGSNPTLIDPATEVVLLTVNQPQTNHNGGGLVFGHDGYLYLGLGDGGGAGDAHGSIGNGQDTHTLLGKMLRIDVSGSARPYGIPAGNPFGGNALCDVGGSGNAACPEIYHYGLRNPWRFSFDRETGTLWIGDVGEKSWEEIDRADDAGRNFGWRCREGAHPFNGDCGGATNFTEPVAEYGHDLGSAITGGYVYRGSSYPSLRGYYVFADFVAHKLFAIPAPAAGAPTGTITGGADTGLSFASLAEGLDGELYGLDYYGGGIYSVSPP